MIHATAIVHPDAKIDESVEIGAYSVIGDKVSIGAETVVGPHVVIEGDTTIGCKNKIFQFASIGAQPQDLKFHGEDTRLVIGDGNQIREFTTLHLGTEGGGNLTQVGNNNLFMAYSHVAHDCVVGNNIVLANGATLAGHVIVDDFAILGGLSAVHQFTKVGCHTMISGGAMVTQDILPYTIAQGDRAKIVGLNLVGLKRRGFSMEAMDGIKKSFKLILRSGMRLEDAVNEVKETITSTPELEVMLDFIDESQRGIAR